MDFKKIFDSNFGKFPESLKDCSIKNVYLATIYFWGHLKNCTSLDDSDFKKCDSSFGKFPERLSD